MTQDQLYNEIDTEVYKLLASAQMEYPTLDLLDKPWLHKLCALMYSEGIRAGVDKCKAILEAQQRES